MEPLPTLRVVRDSFAGRPAWATAVAEATLKRVAAGELGPVLHLHRTSAEMAFSRQDANAAGFDRAVEAARNAGYKPVVRLVGGRAAAFHEGTLAFAVSLPDAHPERRTEERFTMAANLIAGALADLGLDARVGQLEGEYCPGDWSVNLAGRIKVAGIGQRMVRGGAHIGGVIVVTDTARLAEGIVPVYRALELPLDESTIGSIEDEHPGITLSTAEDAILKLFAADWQLEDWQFDDDTFELARQLESRHRA